MAVRKPAAKKPAARKPVARKPAAKKPAAKVSPAKKLAAEKAALKKWIAAEKKKLRLFSLTADRTRAGSGPLLEAMTRSRNWYATCAGIADVDRDGVEDLISAQPKGLGAGSLWVEAHLGKSAGGFEAKVRGSEVAVEEGEICSLEMDVVADETVELIVVEDDSLLIFPLVRAGESKVVVESEPQLRIPFDDISGRPLPLLAAGLDPTPLIVTGRTQGGRQAVRLIRFP